HHEKDQRPGSRVAPPVLLTGGGTGEVARTEFVLLVADADEAPAGDHVVELVADGMPVAGLLLARLEAVGVAEEAGRIHQPDLLHLACAEHEAIADVNEMVHPDLLASSRDPPKPATRPSKSPTHVVPTASRY